MESQPQQLLVDSYTEAGYEIRTKNRSVIILAKPIEEFSPYQAAVILIAEQSYYGILYEEKSQKSCVHILNDSKDAVPKFKTRPSIDVVDCKPAFQGSNGMCYMSQSGTVALECTTPDPMELHGVYELTKSEKYTPLTKIAEESTTEQQLNAINDRLRLPCSQDELRNILKSIEIAPKAWYDKLEPMVLNELAREDPLCTMERKAEGAYELLGMLFRTRATDTRYFLNRNNLGVDDFRAIMTTLDKWKDNEHLEIVRATHMVMHAVFAIRYSAPRNLNFGVQMALWNRPLSTIPMTLTEAVLILHQWVVNEPQIDWGNQVKMGELPKWFVIHGDQIVFYPPWIRSERSALCAQFQTYIDAVLKALEAGTQRSAWNIYAKPSDAPPSYHATSVRRDVRSAVGSSYAVCGRPAGNCAHYQREMWA